MRGLFVTFEGIDRSGKTTQARMLGEALGEDALGVREPGGTEVGERVRELLKDPAVELGPEGEALLFAAARAELVARGHPAGARGGPRGGVRPLPRLVARLPGRGARAGVDEVGAVNALATGGLRPDLTFLLALDPAAAEARAGESDRFEDEGRGLQERVLAAYERAGRGRPGPLAAHRRRPPPEEVHAEVLAEVEAARSGARA